jgi:hypothetical protein
MVLLRALLSQSSRSSSSSSARVHVTRSSVLAAERCEPAWFASEQYSGSALRWYSAGKAQLIHRLQQGTAYA